LDGTTQLGDQCQRVSTDVFSFGLRGQEALSDGYWLLLNLEKGKHTLSSFGSCRSGKIQIAMDYVLDVYYF
jgi:hypothetical protein